MTLEKFFAPTKGKFIIVVLEILYVPFVLVLDSAFRSTQFLRSIAELLLLPVQVVFFGIVVPLMRFLTEPTGKGGDGMPTSQLATYFSFLLVLALLIVIAYIIACVFDAVIQYRRKQKGTK